MFYCYDKNWSDDIGTGGANWYNSALKYFGFKGTYDPSIYGVGQVLILPVLKPLVLENKYKVNRIVH